MNGFAAQARITLPDPEKVMSEVCDHLAEHDAQIESTAGGRTVRFNGSVARISWQGGSALVEVSAPTLETLYFMRVAIVSHIREFAADGPPAIRWSGDGQDIVHPPNFRILQVVAARDVTPHMRRLTLAGDDVERFAPLDALHVNLLIPNPGASEAQWPRIGPDGLIFWENPQHRPFRRKYTIRAVDVAAGTVDIDFVLHDHGGPGSTFAARAKPGDRVGTIGPGGGGLVAADWYLLAGDATALPAIARMLAHLPANARGKAIIQVAGPAEAQALACRAPIEVEWLFRDGAQTDASRALPAAVEAVRFPDDGSSVYAWAGCEYDDFRAIRAYLRQERGLRKREHLAVSYWRRGKAEEG